MGKTIAGAISAKQPEQALAKQDDSRSSAQNTANPAKAGLFGGHAST